MNSVAKDVVRVAIYMYLISVLYLLKKEEKNITCNLYSQMRGMSKLKSVCPVILSGNLVAIIFSPGYAITLRSAVPLPPDTNVILIDF